MKEYNWNIEIDGTFEIQYKGIKLISGYPGIDGKQIKPLGIEIKKIWEMGFIRHDSICRFYNFH